MNDTLRPSMRLLSDSLRTRIVQEAREALDALGVYIANDAVVGLLVQQNTHLRTDGRVRIGGALIDQALASAPAQFSLHGRDGELRAPLGAGRACFTPGSSVIHVLDSQTGENPIPTTPNYTAMASAVQVREAT